MKKRLLPMLLSAAAAVAVIASAAPAKPSPSEQSDVDFQRNLSLFNALTRTLQENYVDSIRTADAFKAAIGAMLNTVDPYTEYYDADDRQSLATLTTGAYGGIGSTVMSRDGNSFFSEPLADAPAYKAGIRAGDKILRIDSVDIPGMKLDEVVKLLKGQPGTPLTVRIQRPFAADSIRDIHIVREKVQEQSVPFYGVIDGNMGYVALTSFIEKSPAEVEEALRSFKDNPEVKGVVLDLRGNGGGLVSSAVEILGFFLPKGTEVLTTKGKTKAAEETYRTTHTPLLPDMPLAVLIDGGSASASEITAGAIQDLDRGVLIGSNSYGKGLVQGTFPLPYDALLKVTIAKYYTPSGRLIQALDYSRRNEDGSVARTPDSLTHVYRTLHGREVRDGGGLTPDSVVEWGKPSRLIYDLVMNHHIFDYATRYAATHPSIPAPGEFVVTDEIFEDFTSSLDTAKVKGYRAGLDLLDAMRTTAESEGFTSPQLEQMLDSLQPLVAPDLHRDLANKREDLSRLLAEEMVGRYYLRRGSSEAVLRYDPGIRAARDILGSPELYRRFLSPAEASVKNKTSKPKKK